ncbi:MAG: hypothetical protein ACT4P7_02265 [Gemmatimonadaceae bacterium]
MPRLHPDRFVRAVCAAGRSRAVLLRVTAALAAGIASFAAAGSGTGLSRMPRSAEAPRLFETSDGCMACHNGLTTSAGEDVSIGKAWRATMMANSARDPYWQASVRREVLDHPERRQEIEDECSTCHMPMMRTQARVDGHPGEVFAHLPIDNGKDEAATLAADGVSCTLCHQMQDLQLGKAASFSGGFSIDATLPRGKRPVFGRYDVDEGRQSIMHSSSEFIPARGDHIRSSELCATCHTLYTSVKDANGRVLGRLPEQVPYLEWKHSGYTETTSCQTCHMPAVAEPMPISSVWGQQRERLARHEFRGGNFFMLQMLDRYRGELGVTARPEEMAAAVRSTVRHLQEETARLAIDGARLTSGRLEASVVIGNLSGHKLPTAYPSRRAWLHVVVRDATGETVFESGAVRPDGSIAGNANDASAAEFEPHYTEISRSDQVQIYESILADTAGRVTTGLLSAVRFVKDNRLLPDGFNPVTASADIAVRGEAVQDPDFLGGGDRVTYSIDVSKATGPFQVAAVLRFQPIAYRWAKNLEGHAAETNRFVAYYDAMAGASSVSIAESVVTVR